jgi:nitrite reductase (NO-forming)
MPRFLRRSTRRCRWFVLAVCLRAFAADGAATPAPELPDAAQLERGRRVYRQLCAACHLPDGRGIPTVTPPLFRPDRPLHDRERATRVVLHGLPGSVTAGAGDFSAPMPPLGPVLSDRQISDVLTFVFHRWGAAGAAFEVENIAAARTASP